jgi:Mn-containing catalase
VHHLQGKAEGVTPTELQSLIRDFFVERLALLLQHEAVARHISDYDVNNAYQYVIAREETHVSWLQHALLDLGTAIPAEPGPTDVKPSQKGKDGLLELSRSDATANTRFVEKWRDRVEQVTHARHRGMLRVVLGEMLEHARLFEQAAQGRTDIIGKSLPIHTRRGSVIGSRWIE